MIGYQMINRYHNAMIRYHALRSHARTPYWLESFYIRDEIAPDGIGSTNFGHGGPFGTACVCVYISLLAGWKKHHSPVFDISIWDNLNY